MKFSDEELDRVLDNIYAEHIEWILDDTEEYPDPEVYNKVCKALDVAKSLFKDEDMSLDDFEKQVDECYIYIDEGKSFNSSDGKWESPGEN